MKSMDGRTAVVCGAGGGLGGAVASELAARGAQVVGVDRSAASLEALQRQLAERDATVDIIEADLGRAEDIAALGDTVRARYGAVDLLFNNTGGPPPGPITDVDDALWMSSFETMVLGPVRVTREFLPGMRERGFGRVVTSASSGVTTPIPNLGLSNSLRSALLGWNKTIASEAGRDGVTFNIVVPGRIATRRVQQLDEAKAEREGRQTEEVSRESAASIPVGRYGTPEEYASLVAFLMEESSSFINGALYRVDGGMIPSVV